MMLNKNKILLYGAIGATITMFIIVIIIVAATNSTGEFFPGSTILDNQPIVDGQNDFTWGLRDAEKNDLTNFNFINCSDCVTTIEKLKQGKVSTQFLTARSACKSQYKDSVAITLEEIDVIKRLITKYHDHLELVTEADGINSTYENEKIGIVISIEGGHSIDLRIPTLRMYYDLGVRRMTLVHGCATNWGIPNTDKESIDYDKGFLTKVVEEMNRLGMIIDLTHLKLEIAKEVIEISKAPVVFSHSIVNAICEQDYYGLDNETLELVKENNGIVMINFRKCPQSEATIEGIVKHINFIVSNIGIDFVGLGASYGLYNSSSFPSELSDVSKYPILINNFNKWSVENIGKLLSGNIYRVFRAVEEVKRNMTETEPVYYNYNGTYDDACHTDL